MEEINPIVTVVVVHALDLSVAVPFFLHRKREHDPAGLATAISAQYAVNNLRFFDSRQPCVQTLEGNGETAVINSQQVKHGGM